MPHIEYIPKKFSAASLKLIETANEIIEEYQAQGFDLTLRQLYYQFVARDLIPNKQKEYKRLGSIINDARLAGMIDWEAIVDRTRNLRKNGHWGSPREIVESCAQQYQIDKWKTQENRLEVWIEKDALVGIVEGICSKLDVPFFSCRGYTSQSEMWEAAQRLVGHAENGQHTTIIHLGDHDPSGKDMTRDIDDRIRLFMEHAGVDPAVINRIALNMDQIKQYNPPPNPAKITDSRAREYMKRYGGQSWELDALDPKVLHAMIEKEIKKHRDDDAWMDAVALQNRHRDQLLKAATKMKE